MDCDLSPPFTACQARVTTLLIRQSTLKSLRSPKRKLLPTLTNDSLEVRAIAGHTTHPGR